MDEIEKYYNKFNEDKRLLSRHGQVEFFVTTFYINKVIDGKTNLNILDIGAGTGRYSDYFEKQGQKVTAVELVKHNYSRLKQNYPNIKAYNGNAKDLSFLKDESFDITLLLGPMYHLFSTEEKVKALNEAKRVTKKGGYIFVGYLMNEYAVIMYAFKEGNLQECLKNNMLDNSFHTITTKKDLYNYVRLEDINKINDLANIQRQQIVAVDGITDYIRPVINNLNEEDFEVYKNYILSISNRSELVGASSHTLDILKK